MIRSLLMLCLLTLMLSACSTTSQRQPVKTAEPDELTGSSRQRMEEAIARRILRDVREELPALPVGEQPGYLREKKQQFEKSVDMAATSERVRHEKRLLDYLLRQTDFRVFGSGYLPKLHEKSSLDWSLAEFTEQIKNELNRIDQTIAVLADATPENFNLGSYMTSRREQATYQDDSFEGRQAYLDNLADAMLDSQLNWYDTLENYVETELAIYGEEDMDQMFRFTNEGLTINLTNTSNLPDFELNPLAVYYGFPGLQSLTNAETDSLKQFIRLPAYRYGWGAFMVEVAGTRDTDETIDYLLFSRTLVALALADIYLNTGIWTRQQAANTLQRELPYSAERIQLMLQQAIIDPGQYAATVAGKLMFVRLQEQCLAAGRGDVCHSVFNQRIVDWGPLPFGLLEQRLFR